MIVVLASLLFLAPAARVSGAAADPFAGVAPAPARARAKPGFFSDNFGFRKELMSQFSAAEGERASSRQSAGVEVLKKFSSETRTFAAVNFQGRLVRRDRFVESPNDMEGARRPGWSTEHHNAYADFYNFLDPLLKDEARGAQAGRWNARAGRFYVPFGLNPQTDTHGTLLQLSNERNFGFERDWYAGLWGNAVRGVKYDAYYLAGSGHDIKSRGQSGLAAARASLSDKLSAETGHEGGLSYLGGERLDHEALPLYTSRAGGDWRWRRAAPGGSGSWTTELSGGKDGADSVFTQLHQLEYLRASRRWGLSAQYARFWKAGPADASLIGEASWYFRNDPGNSNLHWIKVAVERKVERREGALATIVTAQYYRYW